ncbi:protein RESTRICTED TEV MOVEMENT 2-like [Durio zibethinus]|uniref:Protein RESTRICTED TEV MOVEMENT 2-like n=1 Tax=Durio zibethinus TaxID=66656 RepID=A0A6P5YSE1_DURZI|nr:protein RESTRICTED TEV MOVEMENT 2-like [Durio zibethinus]
MRRVTFPSQRHQFKISPKHQFINTNQTRSMAGRSRTNVSTSIYEDLQPQCEQTEEQGAYILLIHLPDFPKEQISVTYVSSSRTIKVEGERALERNRRSRFNQAFPVPQNCIIEKIEGSYRNDVLTITMPKQTITQVGPVKDASIIKETTPPKAISEKKPTKDQKEATPPKAALTSGFENQRDEKLQPPQTPQKAAITQTKAPTATVPQIAPPKAQTNGKKVEALQPSNQQQETQKKVLPIATTTKQTQEKTAGSTSEIVEKKAESKDGLPNLVKEEESGKTKDSTMSETNIPKISEKEKKYDTVCGALEEKPKEGGKSFLEKAKEMKGMETIMKTVKRLATDDYEDRQLLINIGVSVLVILALGAYITYSYPSSGKAKD